jgi:hypothetical protein
MGGSLASYSGQGYKQEGQNMLYATLQEAKAREARQGITNPTPTGVSHLDPRANSADIQASLDKLTGRTPYQPTTTAGKVASFAGSVADPTFLIGAGAGKAAGQSLLSKFAPQLESRVARGAALGAAEFAPFGLTEAQSFGELPGDILKNAAIGAGFGTAGALIGKGIQGARSALKPRGVPESPIPQAHPLNAPLRAQEPISTPIQEPPNVMESLNRFTIKPDQRTTGTSIPKEINLKGQFLKDVDTGVSPIEHNYYKSNLETLKQAKTGQPTEFIGFRQNRGQEIPGTGRFYSISGTSAGMYGGRVGGKWTALGPKNTFEVKPVKLENPLIVDGGHYQASQQLMYGLEPESPMMKQLIQARSLVSRSAEEGTETGYALYDKVIAKIAKEQGYDGLVYRKSNTFGDNASEIISLKSGEVKLKPRETKAAAAPAERSVSAQIETPTGIKTETLTLKDAPAVGDTKFWNNAKKETKYKGTVEEMQAEVEAGTLDTATARPLLKMDLQRFAETASLRRDLPTAQSDIIIGRPKEGMGFKEALDKFYTKIVNTQQPITKAGKLAESDIGKLAMNTKNVSGIVDYNFLKGLVDKNGNKVGESLESVVKSIPKNEEKDFWTYMTQRHNIDRAREGKPVQVNYTPEMSKDAVKVFENDHPEYKAIGDNITKWLDDFMQTWGVDTGIVNKEIYKDLRKTYKSYFPTQREFSELEKSIGGNVSQKFADQRTPIRAATGSERNIIDPVENIMNLVNRTIRTAKYNEVGQSLLESVRAKPEKLKAIAEIIPTQEGMFSNVDNVIHVLEDGKPVYLQINDKALLDAMNGLPKTIGNIPVISTLVNGFKSLITQKNPIFALRNIFRDIPTAYVYGSEANPLKFGAGLAGAIKDVVTQGPRLQKYQAVGGGGANFFNQGDVTRSAAELTGKTSIIKKIITSPIRGIEKFNNLTETAPRLAEFNRVLKKTGDVTKALYASNELTVNFARGGNYTKAADKVVPYLNAGVQGLDKFFRGFKDPKTALQTIVKSGIAITTPTVALYMVNKDNPNYRALDNRTKDSYYLIPQDDGTFIKIPKSRELGVLFSSLFERVSRQLKGQEDAFKGFGNTVATSFSPANPIESNFFSPATWNLATNKDFAGRAIVPQGMLMDKRSPYLQYDDKTSVIAKSIGELSKDVPGLPGGLSPKQIDYLIKSYSGVIGQYGIPLVTPGGSPSKALKTQFIADPTFSNQATTDFFDKFDKVSAAAVDKNVRENVPSKKVTTEEDMKNSMSSIISALSRGTREINKIQSSSDPRKDDKIKSIKTEMINAQRKAVDADTPKEMQTIDNWAKKFFKEKK